MPSRLEQTLQDGIERGLHPGVQACVSLQGETVVDLALGAARQTAEHAAPVVPMTTQTACLWMSSGKPATAVAVAQLVEQGDVDLRDPVAEYVEGFEAHGKDPILIEHLLTHTAGLRAAPFRYPDQPWPRIIEVIAAARPEPRWTPGERAGYHVQTAWFLLGEVVQSAAGMPIGQYLRGRVFEPVGMHDAHVGMPEALHDDWLAQGRLMAMHDTADAAHDKRDDPARLTTKPWLTAPRPGGNLVASARSMARFYEALLDAVHGPAGALHHATLLQPETVRHWTARRRTDMIDQTFRVPMDWGLGFMVNNRRHAEHDPMRMPYNFGPHASDDAFGHGGHQSSVAFADPAHGLAVAIVFNGMPGESAHRTRMYQALADVYQDLGLAREAA
ncbi:MAG: serine hydrolase domain-containing protein [Planctomycetota bacterium]